MNYLLGSGYFNRPGTNMDWFWPIWIDNTSKATGLNKAVVISAGGTKAPTPLPDWVKLLTLDGDLGHIGDILAGKKSFPFSSCTVEFCALALLAYVNNSDFIYKEQDMLAFGPWVETMYAACKGKQMVIGRGIRNPANNSLFLIKHAFLPEFVRYYLGTTPEDTGYIAEQKFKDLATSDPKNVGYYDFGYDKDRPFNHRDHVWCAQKLNGAELSLLRHVGLVSYATEAPREGFTFSNDPMKLHNQNQVPVRDKYSEYDEEPFVLQYFKKRNVNIGNFVDVGANNGWKGSNTYALMRRGWSGLEIEADPNTFNNLAETCKRYKNVHCLHAAVWDKDGSITFLSHNDRDSGLSSVHLDFHSDCTKCEVRCLTLDNALKEHFGDVPPIDFMNVDIEGCDYATLKAYSFKVKPQLLMVEKATVEEDHHDSFKAKKEQWQELLTPYGYHLIFESFANLGFELRP